VITSKSFTGSLDSSVEHLASSDSLAWIVDSLACREGSKSCTRGVRREVATRNG